MYFEVRRVIARPPETVWRILTDKAALLSGGFGILNLEGEIAPGALLKLWSEASPGRAFPLKVTQFSPPAEMIWEGGMPLGLFRGVRRFSLARKSNETEFHMREDYSGLLAGLIGRSIPDLNPSFSKFADALKTRSEGQS